MILFKGHNKDRESDRSYRTISTCPFLSKALDKYVGGLCESGWAAAQAETQFQGTGSSHELAALLLTETIQHSLFPAFPVSNYDPCSYYALTPKFIMYTIVEL